MMQSELPPDPTPPAPPLRSQFSASGWDTEAARPASSAGTFLFAGLIACIVAVVVAAVTSGLVLSAWQSTEYDDAAPDYPPETLFEPSVPAEGSIRTDGGWQRFRLEIPPEAVAVDLRATSDDRALNLSAWFGYQDDLVTAGAHADADPDAWTRDAARRQHLHLAEHATPGFAPGPLFVDVQLAGPASDEDPAEFTLRAEVIRAQAEDGTFGAGEIAGRTSPASGFRRTYRIRVPDGADVARFDVVEADGDLDLFVDAGPPSPRTADADWNAEGLICLETLVALAEDTPFPEDRVLSLTVADSSCYDEQVAFRVLVSFSEDVPAPLREVAPLPAPAMSKDRALLACVELVLADGSSGSGTIVRGDGLVLTAAHVVDGEDALDRLPTADDDEDGPAPVVIAFSLDPRAVSRDLFRGHVVFTDPARDVALVKITQGLRGQRLPKGFVFPAAPVARSTTVVLTDEIVAVGYPGVGGSGSRNPITACRGTFSGFDRGTHGLQGKTDALVSPGSSGGAAFDATWTLTGVLVASIDDGSGSALGYFVPIDEVPAAWRALIPAPSHR